ncbi:MAG: hypothetical protein EBZ05_10240 [Verrucomicrobia bacterium]|nr:hypothetical protein [Verrucomicrobiota bacterium]
MKKVVVTQAFGDDWLEVLNLTKPRMEAYCKRHEQDFISIEKPLAHPVQYSKLIIPHLMTTKGYDVVTFLDADVLVALDCPDISKDVEKFCAFDEGSYLDRKPGMTALAKAFGYKIEPRFYVNTGVFVVTKSVAGIFAQPPIGLFPNHFAEQTWMNIMAHLCDLDLQELDPSFNCMTSAEEHFGLNRHKDAYVIHYAGQSADLDKLADQIEKDEKRLQEEIR